MPQSRSAHNNTNATLRHFGFRQTLRGAIIIGLIAGIIMGAQGPAYNAAYPTAASRKDFVATLSAAPALGFMAGETIDASTPASYSIYKSITLMTMVTAIWGLFATARLLRGQEEDGKLEVVLAGQTTKRRATYQLLLGLAGSLLISFLLAFVGIAALGQLPHVDLSVRSAGLLTLGVYLPGILFAGVGVFVSQLARTRSRAVLYGLVPLIVLFVIRGSANSVADLNWLKQWSPFGWVDLLNPVLGPHTLWILPAAVLSLVFTATGIFLAGRRDLGASLLREAATTRSHFQLLNTSLTLSIRQHIWTFAWWALGTLAFTSFLVALAKLSASILQNASGAQAIITKLGHTTSDITLAFIGIGNTVTAMALLIMTILLVARIRRDEARGYLDNLLVQPVRRSTWLGGRLLLIISMVTIIAISSALLSWFIAHYLQRIDGLHLHSMLLSICSLIAVILFTLGIGALIYGWAARLAVTAMIIVISWSYTLDILGAIMKLNDTLARTSLLRYLSTPLSSPDWPALIWLSSLGIVMMILGVMTFANRDIVSE